MLFSIAMLQAATDTLGPLATLGVGGGIAALVLKLWRDDRAQAEKRYEALAADFRTIVQDNTKAITILSEKISSDDMVTVRMLIEALRQGKIINVEAPPAAKQGAGD